MIRSPFGSNVSQMKTVSPFVEHIDTSSLTLLSILQATVALEHIPNLHVLIAAYAFLIFLPYTASPPPTSFETFFTNYVEEEGWRREHKHRNKDLVFSWVL